MSETTHLAEAIEGLFSAPECIWFVTYPAAVAGLTASQAARSLGPRFNSVWGVTLHLSLCQRFALAVLRGDAVDVNEFFAAGGCAGCQPCPGGVRGGAFRCRSGKRACADRDEGLPVYSRATGPQQQPSMRDGGYPPHARIVAGKNLGGSHELTNLSNFRRQ
jgi:hypothetical protein